MMRLMQSKFVSQHYDELARQAVDEAERAVYKRDIGASDRRRIAGEGNAVVGSDGHISYPIENTGDLQNAATLARSGHGDAAAARRLIARRARELGVSNPLDESDDVKKGSSEERETLKGMLQAVDQFATAVDQAQDQAGAQKAVDEFAASLSAAKEAEPDVIKDPEPEAKPKPVKKAKKKPKKLPPWLNKPADGDDGEKDGDSGACKQDHAHTEKCHTTPAEAAGLAGVPRHERRPRPRAAGVPAAGFGEVRPDPRLSVRRGRRQHGVRPGAPGA